MSRRPPNPAADRAAQNTLTIKSLLKLEGNKTCADCKRNKHPRWASWNLGIFVCIRCSGIHRGMGTHISRVKSVDLDAWTDEQMQSVLKWGNARANKYWEAKLAPAHVPSESKIENFIRTKYESKRWVMEGPIPDPSTLDADGDDDVPLSLVKEKHNIERSTSQRASSARQAGQTASGQAQVKRAPQQDLFGDDIESPPQRASSAAPTPGSRPPPKADPAPPKQTKPADSLLGLDFLGSEISAPHRPASAASTPGAQSRPDLKQSILSLYASAPRTQPQHQPSHQSTGSFGAMQSPPIQQKSPTTFGGMNDAFSGLSFSNPASPPIQATPKQSAFSGLGNTSSHGRTPSQTKSPPVSLGGGSFFDIKPTQKSPPLAQQPSRGFSSSSGFGAFDSAPGMSPAPVSKTTASSSGLGDLFDFSTSPQPGPPSMQTVTSPQATSPSPQQPSVFNLSQPTALPPKPQAPASNDWSNNDAWGSNDTWGSSKPSPTFNKPAPPQSNTSDFGWGSGGASLANQSIVPGGGVAGFVTSPSTAQPKVSTDDDFGGWSSAAPASPKATTTQSKPTAGFGANEDLFSNVWQ